eukprot:2662264-Pyramimonas_sp.AAC.1
MRRDGVRDWLLQVVRTCGQTRVPCTPGSSGTGTVHTSGVAHTWQCYVQAARLNTCTKVEYARQDYAQVAVE